MRYLLILTFLSVVAVPALADRSSKDERSPEFKQCIESCKQEQETTAHEGCLMKCAKADSARQQQMPNPSDKK
jgi:hypothetical protein